MKSSYYLCYSRRTKIIKSEPKPQNTIEIDTALDYENDKHPISSKQDAQVNLPTHQIETGNLNSLNCDEIVISSYQFARTKAPYFKQTPWDWVIINKAHRLHNVYKPTNKTFNTIKRALANRKKIPRLEDKVRV